MEPMNDNKLNDLGSKLRYLRRSRNDKVFGGVAGGIAEVFGVETVVVRIAMVVLSVMTGIGWIFYLMAWAMIAKAPEGQNFTPRSNPSFPNAQPSQSSPTTGLPQGTKKMEGRQLMAVAIVSIGVLSLFNRMGINLNGDVLWPLALIGIGSAVLFSKSSNQGRSETTANRSGQAGPDNGGGANGIGGGHGSGGGGWPSSGGFGPAGFGSGGFGPGGFGSGEFESRGSSPTDGSPTDPGLGFAAPAWPNGNQLGTVASDSSRASARLNPYPTQSNDPRNPEPSNPNPGKLTPDDLLNQARREVDELSTHESWLSNPIGSASASSSPTNRAGTIDRRASKKFSRMILGTALVLGGFGAIALRSGWISLGAGIDNVLAIALIGIGAVLLLGARFGRPFGFLGLGAALFALLAGASFVGGKWGDGVGQRAYQPKSLSELQNRYRLGAGTINLDLTKLDFTKTPRVIDVGLGAGAVAIEVPANATVAVSTTTRGGEVTLFGKTDNHTKRKFRIGDAANPQLTLNVRAGVGAIEVARAGKLVKLTDLDSGSLSFKYGPDSTDATDPTDAEDKTDSTDAAPAFSSVDRAKYRIAA